jgi:membrane protein
MLETIARVRAFFSDGIWSQDLHVLPRWRALGIAALRVAIHSWTSFSSNLGGIRAAGLTLITLLALIPLLALAFAVANGFGYRDRLETLLLDNTRDLPKDLQTAVEWIRTLVGRTDFKAMGLIGSLVLVWIGFGLFMRVEEALNHVWRTTDRRPFYRRVTEFIALVVVVPAFALGAISLSSVMGALDFLWLDWLYHAALSLVPPLLLAVAFTAVYKLMPSTDVPWLPAAIGGAFAGIVWTMVHALYLRFQIGVAGANAIYATLAALPLLLIYLQLTWTIVLLGAELAYAVQNVHTLRSKALPAPSWELQRRIGLLAVDNACRAFEVGAAGTTQAELAMRCDLPGEWVEDVCAKLRHAGLLVAVEGTHRLLPARPPATLTFDAVLRALDPDGGVAAEERVQLRPEHEQQLRRFHDATREALSGGTFA